MRSASKAFLGVGVATALFIGLVVWIGFGVESGDAIRNKCWDLGGYARSAGWGGFGTECVVDGKVVPL